MLDLPPAIREQAAISAIVLRSHLDKTYPGAMVASLSVPWGHTGNQRGGYHLVWPRDLVECAGALLALGAEPEARDTLRYLIATQNEDGHWNQNQWLGGTPYWQGLQLDETALPVLLATALDERDALRGIEVEDMVRRALGYIARTGPSTGQDRWEENEGINAFTLAVCIAALVAGAALLPAPECDWALALADFWNEQIEAWTTVSGTELARQYGVPGYYVRVAPPGIVTEAGASTAIVPIRNRRGDGGLRGDQQIGTEFLQLVRFGLRRADDPLILGSLKLADALLRTDTPAGPVWHRYLRRRLWRARGRQRLRRHRHRTRLAAADRRARALRDRGRQRPAALSRGDGGDGEPRRNDPGAGVGCRADPRRAGCFRGEPSGSAMPLAWAHAEFVKLLVSRQINRPFDRPRAVWQRYRGRRPVAAHAFWWPHAPIGAMRAGARLGDRAARCRRSCIGAATAGSRSTRRRASTAGSGSMSPCSTTAALPPGSRVDFTWRRSETANGPGRDERVEVMAAEQPAASFTTLQPGARAAK